MKQYRITIDGRIYEVQIDDPRARPVTARVSGVAFSVDVETVRPAVETGSDTQGSDAVDSTAAPRVPANADAQSEDGAGTGQQSMTAPIPGVVSAVAVRVGQTVERGDELVTIEAMKMFNVIRSPWAGTIATIHTAEGKRVSQGEPLLTFTTL